MAIFCYSDIVKCGMVFEKVLGFILNFKMKRIQFSKIYNFVAVVLLSIIFFSCVSTKALYIEIPQEPKKKLPEEIQSLLLVTRVVDNSYTDLESDSLQRIFYKQSFNYDTLVKDQQMVDTMLQALGALLYESERYDIVIPVERHLDFRKNSLITEEMIWEEVGILCETFNTDAVLSLDYLTTKVYTSFDKNSEYDIKNDAFLNFVEADMKIGYEALFRIYYPAEKEVVYRKYLRDTVYWEDADYTIERLFRRFTPVKKALKETGIAIALDVSGEISPVWRNGKRTYFASGNAELKQAALLVENGDWESAKNAWITIAENTSSKSIKSKAEYNISLAYEMLGDLNSSVEWIIKSYKTMYRTQTVNYMEILEYRLKQKGM